MIKTVSHVIAVEGLWVVTLVLMIGCAAQHPQVAATQASSLTGDNQVACRREALTGSLVPTKVCATKAESDQEVRAFRDQVDAAKTSASRPGVSPH
jgi:hypothetical protein